MGHSKESSDDSSYRKSHSFLSWLFALGADSFPTARASRPPFFLPEAMVNHKKMVHPPSA